MVNAPRSLTSSTIHSSQLRQLTKEASLMSQLRHPNVCQYLGASLEPPSIIMARAGGAPGLPAWRPASMEACCDSRRKGAPGPPTVTPPPSAMTVSHPCFDALQEYCSRRSLDSILAAAHTDPKLAKLLSWPRLLSMACDAAKGMLYLHSRAPPVAHRDLKSANLLVDGQWHVKVADFNLSRPMEKGAAVSTLAVTNPRWLAPCILSGEHGGLAADVW